MKSRHVPQAPQSREPSDHAKQRRQSRNSPYITAPPVQLAPATRKCNRSGPRTRRPMITAKIASRESATKPTKSKRRIHTPATAPFDPALTRIEHRANFARNDGQLSSAPNHAHGANTNRATATKNVPTTLEGPSSFARAASIRLPCTPASPTAIRSSSTKGVFTKPKPREERLAEIDKAVTALGYTVVPPAMAYELLATHIPKLEQKVPDTYGIGVMGKVDEQELAIITGHYSSTDNEGNVSTKDVLLTIVKYPNIQGTAVM